MIKVIFLIALFFQETVTSYSSGGAMYPSCNRSFECASGSCCRNSNNQIMDPSHELFNVRIGGNPLAARTGRCIPGGAELGKVCGGACSCQRGLVCYRSMSGICCLASRCRTKAYVDKKNKFWRNCMSNPNCHFPQ